MSYTYNPFTGSFDASPSSFKRISLDTLSTLTAEKGQVVWNDDEETLDVGLARNVTLQLGQEEHYHVTSGHNDKIAQGTPVQYAGTIGNTGKLKVVPWDGTQEASTFLGIATSDIYTDESGYITCFGKVRGIPASGELVGETWENGDILYVHSAGRLTKVRPVAPNPKIATAVVISNHQNNGTLFVRPSYGSNLGDDELVQLTSLSEDDILVYNGVNARFENKNPLANSIITANVATALTASSPTYQFINPTANIDLALPTVTTNKGFVIKNTGTTGYGITVKFGGVTIPPSIGNGYSMTVIWNGVNWEVL